MFAKKGKAPPTYHWKLEDRVLHIPNLWSVIGRLFLAPFLVMGVVLVSIAIIGFGLEIFRGRFGDLLKELPIMLGMLAIGGLMTVGCWVGVFSWYTAVLDGRKRTLRFEEGAWPWIKRWTEPVSNFRAVSVEEQEQDNDPDGPAARQEVRLLRIKAADKHHVLERCDTYAEAQALAATVSSLMKIPIDRRPAHKR